MNTSALLIDSNLGFAFWLAKVLDDAGYQAFPARSVADAARLISEIEMSLQLLILSGTLEGGTLEGAEALVANLRQRYQDIRVLRLLDPNDSPGQPMRGVDLEIAKPEEKTEHDQAELLLVIKRMLASKPVTGAV